MDRLVKIGGGFNHSGDGDLGKVIIRASAPLAWQASPKKLKEVPSHAFVWFEFTGDRRVYFEALQGQGWLGPQPIAEVEAWAAENPEKRWVRMFDLTDWFSHRQIEEAYAFSERMKSYWTYNTPQLALMLRTAGLARMMTDSSPNAVICSEAASRVLHNDFLDFREWTGKAQHDWINPFRLMQACIALTRLNPQSEIGNQKCP